MGRLASLASKFSLPLTLTSESDLRAILRGLIIPQLTALPTADGRRKRYVSSGQKSQMDILTDRMFVQVITMTDIFNGVDHSRQLFNSMVKYMISNMQSVDKAKRKRDLKKGRKWGCGKKDTEVAKSEHAEEADITTTASLLTGGDLSISLVDPTITEDLYTGSVSSADTLQHLPASHTDAKEDPYRHSIDIGDCLKDLSLSSINRSSARSLINIADALKDLSLSLTTAEQDSYMSPAPTKSDLPSSPTVLSNAPKGHQIPSPSPIATLQYLSMGFNTGSEPRPTRTTKPPSLHLTCTHLAIALEDLFVSTKDHIAIIKRRRAKLDADKHLAAITTEAKRVFKSILLSAEFADAGIWSGMSEDD